MDIQKIIEKHQKVQHIIDKQKEVIIIFLEKSVMMIGWPIKASSIQ